MIENILYSGLYLYSSFFYVILAICIFTYYWNQEVRMDVADRDYLNYARFQSQAFNSFSERIVDKTLTEITFGKKKTVTGLYLLDKILLYMEFVFKINISSELDKIFLHFDDKTVVSITASKIETCKFDKTKLNQKLNKIVCNLLLNKGIYQATIDLDFPDNDDDIQSFSNFIRFNVAPLCDTRRKLYCTIAFEKST
jgi:hypothetical protein